VRFTKVELARRWKTRYAVHTQRFAWSTRRVDLTDRGELQTLLIINWLITYFSVYGNMVWSCQTDGLHYNFETWFRNRYQALRAPLVPLSGPDTRTPDFFCQFYDIIFRGTWKWLKDSLGHRLRVRASGDQLTLSWRMPDLIWEWIFMDSVESSLC
jgi:hypothetical protein